MTGVYLYCIAPGGHGPGAGRRGLDDRPLLGRDCGPFTLWLSELEAAPRATVDAARRHNEVVAAASGREVTPVPVRFGQWFATPEALERRVLDRCDAYAAWLRELAGALEFGIRVLEAVPPSPSAAASTRPATGREYLEALARRDAAARAAASRAESLAAELRAALGGLVRRDRVEPPADGRGHASIAHLVARRDFERYGRRIAELRARRPALRLVVSGPWPPYSFVG